MSPVCRIIDRCGARLGIMLQMRCSEMRLIAAFEGWNAATLVFHIGKVYW